MELLNFIMKRYVSFIFHIQININCEKCVIVAILILSQFTPIHMPKSLKNVPGQALTQIRNCKWNIIYHLSSILVQFSLKWGVVFFSEWYCNFQSTFVDFRFMIFTKVLMEELARVLIHVRKIFKCRVFFKMLLSMCLVIVEKKL